MMNYELAGVDDSEELLGYEGGTANQTAVYIGVGEQLCSVLVVATAAIEDGGVVSHSLTVLCC